MKFLPANERVELGLHKSKTSGRREKRQVSMEFVMPLDGHKVSGTSAFIAVAWKSIKRVSSGICMVELDRMIESQNVRFYGLPKAEDFAKEETLRFEAVDLVELRLEKMPAGTVALFFKVVQPIGKDLWDWLFAAEQAETLYAEFEECQTDLLSDRQKSVTLSSGGNSVTLQ